MCQYVGLFGGFEIVLFFDSVAPSIHTAISSIWCSLKEANSLSSKRMINSMRDLIIVKNLNISIKPPRIIGVNWFFSSSWLDKSKY